MEQNKKRRNRIRQRREQNRLRQCDGETIQDRLRYWRNNITIKRRKNTACYSVKDWKNETERRNSMSQCIGRRDKTRQSKEGSALDRIVKKKLSIGGWTWDDLMKRNSQRHADKGINSKRHEEKEETAKDMQRQGETTRDTQRKEETARDM